MGDIVHDDENLEGVTVQVFENGRILRTIAANKRGKYQIEIPFNKQYSLVYRSPYMIPVSIQVNTSYTAALSEDVLVKVPLNMELFKRYRSLDITPYKSPIGIVKESLDDQGEFRFYANVDALSEIKLVNKKSEDLLTKGEKPIETDNAEIRQIFFTESAGKDIPVSESNESDINKSPDDKWIDPTIDEDEGKISAAKSQYNQQEIGYEASNEALRLKQVKTIASKENASDNQYEYIFETKELRSRELQAIENRHSKMVDAKVQKQAYLAELITNNVNSKTSANLRQVPQSRTNNAGFIFSEEIIKVNDGEFSSTYRHDNYDWLFFEVNYYYKGKEEITKEQYDQVKSLFE